MLYPTTLADVLAFQLRETLCCGGGVPEPFAVCTMGELGALLLNVVFADAFPEAVGAKTTEYGTLDPDGIVTGNVIPLKENSASLTVADVTVTGPLLALRLADWLWLVPTTTLPKLTLAGDTPNCPGATPVPVSGTCSVGFEAFDVATRLPLTLPPACGAKMTLKFTY